MPLSLEQNKVLEESSRLDDAQLLNAYTNGDEAAFEFLLKKYFGLVYSVALRQLRDPHLAEEAAQTVFIILAKKARSLSSRVPPCGWLLRTARFVCRDVLKTRRRRLELEQAFEIHLNEQSGPDGGSVDVALLEEALLALSPREQACVLARFFEGRTFKEVGDQLGIREEAAQKKLSRCLEKMRRFLMRRGASTPGTMIPVLLRALVARPIPEQLVQSALETLHASWTGKVAGGTALMLAEHCLRLMSLRGWALLVARVTVPLLLVTGGGWALWSCAHAFQPEPPGFNPSDPRVETLGKAWSQVVMRVAVAKHKYTKIPGPNDPEFQAYNADISYAVTETPRIMGQFYAGLSPAQEPQMLAEFLTVEMRETLKLDATQQGALLAFIRKELSQRPTLKDSEKAIAQSRQVEADKVKVYLSRSQQQLFDRVYGADGMCLFQFIQLLAAEG